VKNTSDYMLLPGPVNVFLDSSFVSKATIKVSLRLTPGTAHPPTSAPQSVSPGDTFDCTFGVDYALPITYVRRHSATESDGGAFADRQKTTTYNIQVTVKNKHRFAITGLVIRDSVPIATQEIKQKIKVVLREPDGLADVAQGELVSVDVAGGKAKARWAAPDGDKEGSYEWICNIDAGKALTLATKFEVRAPTDVAWQLSF
jgi:hypothetical protein